MDVAHELKKLRKEAAAVEMASPSPRPEPTSSKTHLTIGNLEQEEIFLGALVEEDLRRWFAQAPAAMAQDKTAVTRAWIECVFVPVPQSEEGSQSAVRFDQVYQFYREILKTLREEHTLLDEQDFRELIRQTFADIELIEDDVHEFEIRGLRWIIDDDIQAGNAPWCSHRSRDGGPDDQIMQGTYDAGNPNEEPENVRNDSVQMPGGWPKPDSPPRPGPSSRSEPSPQTGLSQHTDGNVGQGHVEKLDGDGVCRAWMKIHLVRDLNCLTDAKDIHRGLCAMFKRPNAADDKFGEVSLHESQLADLLTVVFPSITILGKGEGICRIDGLRWKKLDEGSVTLSFDLHVTSGMENVQVEGHKLLCIPEPDRTTLWLSMYFENDPNATVTWTSFAGLYGVSFPYHDTNPALEKDQFMKCIGKAFSDFETVEVSPGHYVLKGIGLKETCLSADQVIAQKREEDYRRAIRKGLIESAHDPPLNLFCHKLSQDPLFNLRDHTSHGTVSSSLNARLQRRGKKPHREPLGDEEPGFPGISMKKEQKRLKRKWAEVKELHRKALLPGEPQTTFAEWCKAADDIMSTMPLAMSMPPERHATVTVEKK